MGGFGLGFGCGFARSAGLKYGGLGLLIVPGSEPVWGLGWKVTWAWAGWRVGIGLGLLLVRHGLGARFGLETGVALVFLSGLCFPRLVGLEMGLGAIGLVLASNFLVREWGWGECGGWIYFFVGVSLFFLCLLFFPVLPLGWPGFLTIFFCCPFRLLIGLICCHCYFYWNYYFFSLFLPLGGSLRGAAQAQSSKNPSDRAF